jgi:hypothetical protein
VVAGAIALAGAAASAYGARKQSKAQKEAARAANAPQESSRDPWLAPHLTDHVGEILRQQNRLALGRLNNPEGAAAHLPGPVGGGGGGGGGGSGGEPSYGSQAGDVFNRVADWAGDYNSPFMESASGYVGNTLGTDNFAGRNAYLDDLSGRLGGASFDRSIGMFEDFLGSELEAPQLGGAGGGFRAASYNFGGGGAGPPVPEAGGGEIPDTMAQGGWVADRIRDLWDESRFDPANDPTLAPYVDALQREALEGYEQSVADLNASAEGAGRFGSGLYTATRARANEEYNEGLQAELARVYMGAREANLGRAMEGLGLASNRDLTAMGDLTAREGIAAGERNTARSASASRAGAAASAASARYATDVQAALQSRGQNLEAIRSVMGMDQYGLSMLGQVGQGLSDEQQNVLGMVPGLEQANLLPLQQLLGAGQGLAGLESTAAGERNARTAVSAQNNALRWQQQVYQDQAAQREIDNYLRTIATIGGMGGTGTSPGAHVPVPSTSAAAVQGGLGGAALGFGLYGMYGGGGAPAPAPAPSGPPQTVLV